MFKELLNNIYIVSNPSRADVIIDSRIPALTWSFSVAVLSLAIDKSIHVAFVNEIDDLSSTKSIIFGYDVDNDPENGRFNYLKLSGRKVNRLGRNRPYGTLGLIWKKYGKTAMDNYCSECPKSVVLKARRLIDYTLIGRIDRIEVEKNTNNLAYKMFNSFSQSYGNVLEVANTNLTVIATMATAFLTQIIRENIYWCYDAVAIDNAIHTDGPVIVCNNISYFSVEDKLLIDDNPKKLFYLKKTRDGVVVYPLPKSFEDRSPRVSLPNDELSVYVNSMGEATELIQKAIDLYS